MNVSEFATLFTIAFVFVITPGPGTLAVFAKSISQGFFPALYLSFGMVLGDLVYLSVVIFSLDFFAGLITYAMDYVRVIGGLYLVYLGIRTWNAHKVKLSERSSHKSNINELTTGFIISITNPKVMIFYIAILPIFIDLSRVDSFYAVQILLTVGLGLLFGISVINASVAKIKILFAKPGTDQLINQLVAVVMILVGVLLGLS